VYAQSECKNRNPIAFVLVSYPEEPYHTLKIYTLTNSGNNNSLLENLHTVSTHAVYWEKRHGDLRK